MSTVTPRRFTVLKQGELDYFCGLYCLAMLRWNVEEDENPSFGQWIEWHRHSGTKGFSTRKLAQLCRENRKLSALGLERVKDGDLTRYEYGIAMVASVFKGSDGRYTHYVVFFNYRGRTYIADPHPERSRKSQLLEKTSFREDWNIEKKGTRWARLQDTYWPGPRWAMGKPLPESAK